MWYGRPKVGAHAGAAAALAGAAAQWLPALGAQLGPPARTGTVRQTRRAAAAADAMLLLARCLALETLAAGNLQPLQARAAWLDRHSLLLAPAAEPGSPHGRAGLAEGCGDLAEQSAGEEGAAGRALLCAAAQLETLLQHLECWRALPAASGNDEGEAVCQGSLLKDRIRINATFRQFAAAAQSANSKFTITKCLSSRTVARRAGCCGAVL